MTSARVARCFQRPYLCLSPATIPPLRGRHSRSRAEEKTDRSGRDDRKIMTCGGGAAGRGRPEGVKSRSLTSFGMTTRETHSTVKRPVALAAKAFSSVSGSCTRRTGGPQKRLRTPSPTGLSFGHRTARVPRELPRQCPPWGPVLFERELHVAFESLVRNSAHAVSAV